MVSDILISRFERYFRDPSVGDGILRPGASGAAIANVWRAVQLLGIGGGRMGAIPFDERSSYDEELRAHVRTLQKKCGHRATDGLVGPGTRRMLASQLLARFDADIFFRLVHPESDGRVSLFLSYAWADETPVGKLDQWLRDRGVRVIRDQHWFVSGQTLPTNITNAVATSDKVLAVYSKHSIDRDWPRVELALAEQVEARTGTQFLLYLRLDESPLPQHDHHRLAISAGGRPLREVGQDVLHGIGCSAPDAPEVPYNENEPL